MKIIEEGKISGSQFMWLLVTIVLPTAVLFIPALTIKEAGTSAWISGGVTATIWGLVIIWITSTLGERFPGMTFVDYSSQIVGKYPGRFLGFFYMIVFIYVNVLVVREFGEFLVTAFMPETPLIVFNFFLLALAASAVRNGVEVIARMNHFVVSLMFFALIFIFTLVFGEADFKNLTPFLEGGIKPIIHSSLTPMGWRGELVLLMILLPYLNNYKEARYAGYKATILLGAVLAIDIIMALVVFGQQAANYVFPIHTLATYISVAGFVERVEAFVLALWVAGITMKVSIWYYCITVTAARTFNLKDYKPIVIPLGVIQLAWSYTAFDNIRQLVEFFEEPWITFALFFEFVIPVSLLLLAVLRKKGGAKSG